MAPEDLQKIAALLSYYLATKMQIQGGFKTYEEAAIDLGQHKSEVEPFRKLASEGAQLLGVELELSAMTPDTAKKFVVLVYAAASAGLNNKTLIALADGLRNLSVDKAWRPVAHQLLELGVWLEDGQLEVTTSRQNAISAWKRAIEIWGYDDGLDFVNIDILLDVGQRVLSSSLDPNEAKNLLKAAACKKLALTFGADAKFSDAEEKDRFNPFLAD